MTTVAEFIAALDAADLDPRPAGPDRWMARCPAHADRKASLSVGVGDNGRFLAHCFAGCSFADVRAALNGGATLGGKTPREPEPAPTGFSEALVTEWHTALHHDLRREHVARMCQRLRARRWQWRVLDRAGVGWHAGRFTIPCRNANGELVGVVRYSTSPGRAAKSIAIKGSKRELFPRPEGVRSKVVWLVEGEADALALLSTGVAAVSVPGCAGWRPEWAPRFTDRYVVVALDCDDPGRETAQRIADDLDGAGVACCVVDLDPERSDGYDVTDFVTDVAAAGGNVLDALVALTEGAG